MKPVDSYLQQLGSRILSEANDLKRTPEALAVELDVSPETVREVIEGRAEREIAVSIVRRMAEIYPISLADIWVEPDDTDDGVRLMRASQSQSTARVFERVDGRGNLSPYYEYRDTAMSRTASFKPEWIRPIRTVENDDANNPDIAYNKGHLMHQMTFFIGEVNFYWKLNGRSHCAALNTGDSNYITPFVPHSFASRNPDRPGLIIAVTYAGEVRAAIDEISRVGSREIEVLSGDMRDSRSAFRALIARRLAAESMPVSELVSRLMNRGWTADRARAACEGEFVPSSSEVEDIAGCLAVRPEDILLTPLDPNDAVVVRRGSDIAPRNFPDGNNPAYRMVELARSPHQPNLKGFEVCVLARSDEADGVMQSGLHEYVYNFGDQPVEIHWNDGKRAALNPGDSAYVRPMIDHAFHKTDGSGDGHLAVVRIPGRLTDGALAEFACFEGNGRARVAGEHTRWF